MRNAPETLLAVMQKGISIPPQLCLAKCTKLKTTDAAPTYKQNKFTRRERKHDSESERQTAETLLTTPPNMICPSLYASLAFLPNEDRARPDDLCALHVGEPAGDAVESADAAGLEEDVCILRRVDEAEPCLAHHLQSDAGGGGGEDGRGSKGEEKERRRGWGADRLN